MAQVEHVPALREELRNLLSQKSSTREQALNRLGLLKEQESSADTLSYPSNYSSRYWSPEQDEEDDDL